MGDATKFGLYSIDDISADIGGHVLFSPSFAVSVLEVA